MKCSTHIVECLRNENVEPEAFASSIIDNTNNASNALIYDSNTYYYSAGQKKPQWWSVNFKRKVSITSYTIQSFRQSGTDTAAIYNWTLSVSFDFSRWKVIHGPTESYDIVKSYTLDKPVNALFARIDGNSLYSPDPTYISFYYVKFFGSLKYGLNMDAISCKRKRELDMSMMKIILLIYS